MTVFKCKMCGANLEISEKQSVATCEFCGTQQTLPKIDDEKKIALFNRANNLRIKSEFDKAAGIYESIIAEFPEEAEAFWGLVLCKYGIEYVDDKDGRKIPTCHRTLPTPIMKDEDFQQACENADSSAKAIYREEAKAIDRIQKKILEIAATEEPYDIFICYKETDDDTGARTEDSSIAQDIYTALTEKGYKVFYARNSLKKVAGTEYEPYIYAALSSTKIMLAIGTKFDYYDAVWVKNEWSRFISMMADDTSKILIPCYKNMDAYDIPDAFSNMQALDMNDVTFFNNLEASMERILPKEKTVVKETVLVNNSANTDVTPLLKRAFMFLEDSDFARADDFCEQVLNIDPECAEAYLGKLMVELEINKRESLKNAEKPFDNKNVYQKIIRYGNAELKTELEGCIEYIKDRNERARLEGIYRQAKRLMEEATVDSLKKASKLFESISAYQDSATFVDECLIKAEEVRKEDIYTCAKDAMSSESYQKAVALFESISDYKNSQSLIEECDDLIEKERVAREKRAKQARELKVAKAKRTKAIIAVMSVVVAVVVAFAIVLNTVIIPNGKYNDAIALMEAGKYQDAILAFEAMDGYKDSTQKIEECNIAILDGKYNNAIALMEAENYQEAKTLFVTLGNYKDCSDKINVCNEALYNDAISLMNMDSYREAIAIFGELDDYKESKSHYGSILKEIAVKETVSAGSHHTVALKFDGTVIAVGYNEFGQCDVSNWTDIVAISAGGHSTVGGHTVCLKSNGTVVTAGRNERGQCDVEDWTDIVAISAGGMCTLGLKSDGMVVSAGNNANVAGWTDIIAISAGGSHVVGLKANGTVVASGYTDSGRCDVSNWTDIVAVSAGGSHTVGLKSDGTVVAIGSNNYGQCDVADWTDIVAVSAGGSHTVGLKSDGTVVAVGYNYYSQCDVSSWTDIVAISTGEDHTVGLKSDGTVVAVGHEGTGNRCNVSSWNNIKIPNNNYLM